MIATQKEKPGEPSNTSASILHSTPIDKDGAPTENYLAESSLEDLDGFDRMSFADAGE